MRFPVVLTGFALLLCASFFDSVRGPLLPLFGRELQLPYEKVSWFLVAGYLSAVVLGRAMIPLVDRFALNPLAAVLACLGPVAAIWAFEVSTLPSLVVFGVLIACTSLSLGSLSNLFVLEGTTPQQRTRYYSLLHAMYGLGSQAAPAAMAFVLVRGWNWRWLLVGAAAATLLVGLYALFLLPPLRPAPDRRSQPVRFNPWSLQGLVVLAFAFYVCAEVVCTMWMVAYLVEARGYTVAAAAPYASAFFICLMGTRVACYFLRSESVERWIVPLGLGVACVGVLVGLGGWAPGFVLAGLSGPFFPIMLARVSRAMPREAPSLMVRIVVASQAALALSHFGMGWATTAIGIQTAYGAPAIGFAVALGLTLACFKAEKPYLKHFETTPGTV